MLGKGLQGKSRARAISQVIDKIFWYLSNQKKPERLSRNAFISGAGDRPSFEQEVRESMERYVMGSTKSGIDGKLIAVKDNICTLSEPTTCASAILDGFRSPFQAVVVEQLEDARAFATGKTNLDEFGMGSHSMNSHFGPVRNHNFQTGESTSAGGSSGGSAVAVATQQRELALGTDTGGSVRFPAAYTGIIGFKPSYGLLSRWGVVAYANSLDTVGLIAHSVPRLRSLFRSTSAGHLVGEPVSINKLGTSVRGKNPSTTGYVVPLPRDDFHDPTIVSKSTFDRRMDKTKSKIEDSVRSMTPERQYYRVGVPKEYNTKELDPTIRRVWLEVLQALYNSGHTIHPVSLPTTQMALSAYYVIAAAEASSNLAKYDGVRYGKPSTDGSHGQASFAATRASHLGEEVRRRILLGSYTLSAGAIDNYFIKAQKVRRLIQKDFNKVFRSSSPLLDSGTSVENEEGVDFLLTPTTPTFPPTLSFLKSRSPLDTFADDAFTVPASLAGLPAISVPILQFGSMVTPATAPDVLPSVGLQIVGQYGSDFTVINFAERLQYELRTTRQRTEQATSAKDPIGG